MENQKGKGSVADRVWALAEPEAEKLGLSVWDVQFVKEGAERYLRIFIDKESGVSIDDCVDMSRAIDPVLDERNFIQGSYQLEVSSPGIDRKLTRPEHFEAFLGAPLQIKLIRPMEDGKREIQGILDEYRPSGEFVIITEDEDAVTLQRKECSSVQLIDEIWEELQALDEEDFSEYEADDAPEDFGEE